MADEVRLIDANALHKEVTSFDHSVIYKDWVQSAIASAPTISDVVPVVRCINCKNFERTYELGGFCLFWPHNGDRPAEVDIDDFCSYGSEKDLEDNS